MQHFRALYKRCKMKYYFKIATESVAKLKFNFKLQRKMKAQSISKSLGITQEELASLLGVSRGQLSMYELGKRNLPTQAKLKLSRLLEVVTTKTIKSETSVAALYDLNPNAKKVIAELLWVNKEKQALTKSKLKKLEEKETRNKAVQQLVQFLKSEKKPKNRSFINSLEQRQRNTPNSEIQLKLAIKLKVLQAEERVLRKYLKFN